MKRITILLLALTILYSCNHKPEKIEQKSDNPNIILLIGDGMGISHISSLYYFDEKESYLSNFRHIGLINTSSSTHKITDSGAGTTAFACGVRTYKGGIGVDKDTVIIENITEYLGRRNYKNGVVASCAITHATPAAFYSHVKSRKMYQEIARQLVSSQIDFFAGGGRKYFTTKGEGMNLWDELLSSGYILDSTALAYGNGPEATAKYGFLMADNHLPKVHEGRGDFLPRATEMALQYLSLEGQAFFLMVEGAQIDWAGHDKDAEYLIAEMRDFDNTVGVALEFAKKHGNTLLIVTSDHETGGFTLAAKGEYDVDKGDYDVIDPVFATPGHSASLVPVFAYGPGAENFQGIYNNYEIFRKILQAVNSK